MASELRESLGNPVAIATDEGSALKRVGEVIPGAPNVREFEAIGGLGGSVFACIEDIEGDPFGKMQLFKTARVVLGVLYDLS